MASSPKCSSCYRSIMWAVTTAGNRIPLDPVPTEGGNIILISRDDKQGMLVRVLKKGDAAFVPSLFEEDAPRHDGLRWTSHFSTCPDAARHRKPRR